jgi:FixJ family two-component response regulator
MDSAVFIVDDDPSIRRALVRLLGTHGYKAKAYASANEFLTDKLPDAPACVILDLRLPDIDGLDIQDALAHGNVYLPVIFMSGQADVTSSIRAMKSGALDFLVKPVDGEELLSAVRTALERSRRVRDEREALRKDREAFDKLTPREQQVCVRIAQGLLNKQVGFELGTSEKTIKAQRAHVMEKLGAGSLADVVRLVERLRTTGGIPLPRATAGRSS